MKIDLNLLIFWRYIEKSIRHTLMNLSKIFWVSEQLSMYAWGNNWSRGIPILSSSCSFSALWTNTSNVMLGLAWYAATMNSTSFAIGWLYKSLSQSILKSVGHFPIKKYTRISITNTNAENCDKEMPNASTVMFPGVSHTSRGIIVLYGKWVRHRSLSASSNRCVGRIHALYQVSDDFHCWLEIKSLLWG